MIITGLSLSAGFTLIPPPDSAISDPYFSNTTLLLNAESGVVDNSAAAFSLTASNVTSGTGKYGTSSHIFNGSSSKIVVNSSGNSGFVFGTGNFTIEFWIKTASMTGGIITPATGTGATYWSLQGGAGALYFQSSYGSVNLYNNTASGIIDGNWHHVAVVRSSGTNKMYFDGVAQATTAADSNNYTSPSSSNYVLGYDLPAGGNTGYFNGQLDDVRITKGVARYTTNFTPPTAALPTQ